MKGKILCDGEIIQIIDTADSYYPEAVPRIGERLVFHRNKKSDLVYKVTDVKHCFGIPTELIIEVQRN